MDLLGWLIFLFALLFSVMLHESGHFATARLFGMKATRYFVGFGPTVWSTHRGETEYGVKALPLGGFVKIIGMTSMDDVDPEDEPRSFRRAPGWQRLIVLAAGSFMHFVLAALIIFGLALGIGIENKTTQTTQLGTVAACVPSSETALANGAGCPAGEAQSPAWLAGLMAGDKVTSFNGVAVAYWTQLANAIKDAKPGVPTALTVQRAGKQVTLHITLAEAKGRGGYLGVAPATVIVFQPVGLSGAVHYAGTGFAEMISGSVSSLAQLPAAIPQLFNKDRSSTAARSVSSVLGAARWTGQVVAANISWQYKVTFVLLLIASLNIFVGVFNMLPLLPLDGGHVAVVIWERLRAWFARLRRKPDPGLVDYRKLVLVSFSIFMALAALGITLILADIVNPVSIV